MRAHQMAADFQLDKSVKAARLSRGNRAKLKLIVGLFRKVPLVIMDEPFLGLDPLVCEDIIMLLAKYARIEEQTMLLSTNEVTEVDPPLDQALLLKHGRVALFESAEKIHEERGISILQAMREAVQ